MGGLLIVLSLVGFGLTLWVLVAGRLRWARIRSRRPSAVLAAVSLGLLIGGGAVVGSPPATSATAAAQGTVSSIATPSAAVRATPSPARPTLVSRVNPSRPIHPVTAVPAHPHPPTSAPARATAQRPPVHRGGAAAAALAALTVKGRAPKTGYSRDQFGPAWADVAGDGCDTRNDVLRRDLTTITVAAGTGGCEVLTGILPDPYSGTTIALNRGQTTGTAVQIDHLVPLSNARQTGAAGWSATTREDFASDPSTSSPSTGPPTNRRATGTPRRACHPPSPSGAPTSPARSP